MTEHASVPLGKSLFYRSTYYGKQAAETSTPTIDPISVVPELLQAKAVDSSVEATFYNKMNESIEQALANAVELLELARQTKLAADQAAEATLARAHEEQAALIQDNCKLSEERDHLKNQIELLREELSLEESQLTAIIAKKSVVQAEMSNLEQRRDDLIEKLQSRLAIMNQIQASLQEGLGIKLEN
jgi:chromosome segregation ATPase